MLTRSEWQRTAEFSAAAKYGEKYAGVFAFRRFLAGPIGVGLAVGLLAFGAYWVWNVLADAVSAPAGHVPTAYWATLGVLAAATGVAFRPRTMPTLAHVLIAKVAVFAFLWLGVLVFGVTAYVI